MDVVVDRADVLHERVHARALLAEPTHAGAQFEKALAKPAGEQWPFERAQLRLDYGEWLRRQRRINDAKPVLAAALEAFRHLHAAPWTRRADAELRACGVSDTAASTARAAVAKLTAQQRDIVILAGRGLTNAESPDMPGRLRRALEASPGRSSVKIVSDRSMQQSDVTLAAHRVANGEIADRLFLSPHRRLTPLPLHPKLGVGGRHQICDLIDQQSPP